MEDKPPTPMARKLDKRIKHFSKRNVFHLTSKNLAKFSRNTSPLKD